MTRDFIRSSSRDFIMSGGRDRNFSVVGGYVTELFANRWCFLPWRLPGVSLNNEQLNLAADDQKRHRQMRINGFHANGKPSGGGPGFEPAFKEIIIHWNDDFHSPVVPGATPFPFVFPTVEVVSESGGGWPSKVGVSALTKTLSSHSCRYQFGTTVDITITIEDGAEHLTDLTEIYALLSSVNGTSLGGDAPAWTTQFEMYGSTPFLKQGPDLAGSYAVIPSARIERSALHGAPFPGPIPGQDMIEDFSISVVVFSLRKCHLNSASAKLWTVSDSGSFFGIDHPIAEIDCGFGSIPGGVLTPPPIEYFDDVRIPIRRNGVWSRYAFPEMPWPGFIIPTCAPEVAG
jgi:hypothetical protein